MYITVACAGFILAGAEKIFRGGRKNNRGGRLAHEGREKIFCPPCFFLPPPAEFNSAPGAEQTRGGVENKKEGETFYDRSLSHPQLTVLFYL